MKYVHKKTLIDVFFLQKIKNIVDTHKALEKNQNKLLAKDKDVVIEAKKR